MNFNYKKVLIYLFIPILLLLFIIVFPGVSSAENKFWPIINCGAAEDPCNFSDAIDTVNRIINWFVAIAASLGALTLAYSGAEILMNPGNVGKLQEAKVMFTKTLWGLFWLLAAWIIVYAIVSRFVPSGINALRFLE